MTHQPDFVAVRPSETDAYGLRDAYVLAHVRYRCQQAEPCSDGRRYWAASYETIAAGIGLRRDAVKRALLSLRGQGAVVAKRFGKPGDQTWAYSADLPSGENAPVQNGADLPSGENATPSGANALTIGRNRPGTRAQTPDVLLSQKERKKREGACAPPPPPSPTGDGSSNTTPRCDRHPHGNAATGCVQCQRVREWNEAQAAEARRQAQAAETEARRRALRDRHAVVASCRLCDDAGYRLPDRVRVCDHDPDSAARTKHGLAQVRAVLDARRSTGSTGEGDTGEPSSDAHKATQPLRHAAKPALRQEAS